LSLIASIVVNDDDMAMTRDKLNIDGVIVATFPRPVLLKTTD